MTVQIGDPVVVHTRFRDHCVAIVTKVNEDGTINTCRLFEDGGVAAGFNVKPVDVAGPDDIVGYSATRDGAGVASENEAFAFKESAAEESDQSPSPSDPADPEGADPEGGDPADPATGEPSLASDLPPSSVEAGSGLATSQAVDQPATEPAEPTETAVSPPPAETEDPPVAPVETVAAPVAAPVPPAPSTF